MIELNREAAEVESSQYLRNDFNTLGVGHHWLVRAGNVEVALIKFAKAAARHSGLVASIHLRGEHQITEPPASKR